MNKLILELAEQAGMYIVDDEFSSGGRFAKKFAELIVKECTDLFEVEWGDEKLTGNDVGYVVKKHFGVEE